jgi:hypothetical protein
VLSYVLQSAALGAAAVMLTGGPAPLVYVLAVVAASAVTLSRPGQPKLLGSLAAEPEELTAATAVSGWIEASSALGGPALAGLRALRGRPASRALVLILTAEHMAVGEFDVSIAGEHLRTLRPGDGFGEIALLHQVRRTASVTACGDGLLYGLDQRPFLDALRPGI